MQPLVGCRRRDSVLEEMEDLVRDDVIAETARNGEMNLVDSGCDRLMTASQRLEAAAGCRGDGRTDAASREVVDGDSIEPRNLGAVYPQLMYRA